MNLNSFPIDTIRWLPGIFQQRRDLNRSYLASFKSENLLQNFYQEAGLWQPAQMPKDAYWGWESPTSQVRGHFLGHWLSASARLAKATSDAELKGKTEWVVAELGRCQVENGGEWVFSIPEKYLDWARRGKEVWAPHYTLHKTLMGLYDAYAFLGIDQALDILEKAAAWFTRWTGNFSRVEMDDLLDYETGGMLEAWANLYGVTGRPEHKELVYRYDRPRLFDRLVRGEDPLTNRHANTTIPEAQGAARAYEVTGDACWREIAEAYWRCAVTGRGTFATGSQTAGEIWTPPFAFASRLGDKNQEHCVVYNMIRLADYFYRWTGDPEYADYIERNLWNGILAQQNPVTGMISYFLPLHPGAHKRWGSPTNDFWCCHGTLVQAHTLTNSLTFYREGRDLVISQYIPTELEWQAEGVKVVVRLELDAENSTPQPHLADGPWHRPQRWAFNIHIRCARPVEFGLKLRLPGWLAGTPVVSLDGQAQPVTQSGSLPSYLTLRQLWTDNHLRLELPLAIHTESIPDQPEMIAYLEGPVVLAGLCETDTVIIDGLHPDNEREWGNWKTGYRGGGVRFKPLAEVVDEAYTVYFKSGSAPANFEKTSDKMN